MNLFRDGFLRSQSDGHTKVGVPARPVDCESQKTEGVVSFDAMAPLGSPLHAAGLWSITNDHDVVPIDTGTEEECVHPVFRSKFKWRDLYRRAMIMRNPFKIHHGYRRPESVGCWISVQKLLKNARKQYELRSFTILSLLPAGMLFLIIPMVKLLHRSDISKAIVGASVLGLLFIAFIGVFFIFLNAPRPDGIESYDDQYDPAGSDAFNKLSVFRRSSPEVEAVWTALSEHAQLTGVPILKGDINKIIKSMSTDQ
jgi:hypothetical protein